MTDNQTTTTTTLDVGRTASLDIRKSRRNFFPFFSSEGKFVGTLAFSTPFNRLTESFHNYVRLSIESSHSHLTLEVAAVIFTKM